MDTALIDAKFHTEKAWDLYTRERNLTAVVSDWQTGTAPDGRPTLTAEIVGPGAAHALSRFAAEYHLVIGEDGQRPQYDIDTPGRTVVVWRTGGVWVQLWHPDETANQPVVEPVVVGRQRLMSRASGRLPFTRRKTSEPAA
ncbi:hypothetical protein [Streptomyces glaucescens]|uniref:hypothetical protein n=1 Tax=Streptomyces glaucescens TaxID=1907 RepID=UPI000A3D5DDF|nr:hypothetical protein [Streptomyces glaucescens]